MKKILLSVLGLIFLTSPINAQQAQSYSGLKSYDTYGGSVGGNEEYTFIVNDRGQTLIHGKYTYSGVNHYETNTDKIDVKYSMALNCKNGFLDGNLTINGNYTAETYKWREGWVKSFATTKLSGVFKEGKPNGLFSITYQDEMKGAASATLKNGKYIGAYSFQGYVTKSSGSYDHKYWYVMKGQLTDDGKLTGKWVYDTQLETYNYTFINDVLISETHGKHTTPPRIQEIAKKLANKQITREEVLAQGFSLQECSIPLNYVVSRYILNDEFNLRELGAKYDFSDYVEKKYTRIVELNTVSKAGFDLLKDAADKPKRYAYFAYSEHYEEVIEMCRFEMNYDKEYDAYYLTCDEDFTKQYGTKVTGDRFEDAKIYLTSSQAKEWLTLLENRALKNIVDFTVFLDDYGYHYGRDILEAYNHYINNTLTDWLYTQYTPYSLRNLKERISNAINAIETNALENIGFKLTEDQKYIYDISSHYYQHAIINGVDTLNEILPQVNEVYLMKEEYDSINKIIDEKLRALTNSSYWYYDLQRRNENFLIQKQHQDIVYNIITTLDSIQLFNTTISSLLSSYTQIEKIYQKKVKEAILVVEETENWETLQNKCNTLQNILEDVVLTKEYISLRDSLNTLNEMVMDKLPANAKKEYIKIYKKCEDIAYYKEETFITQFADLFDAQNGYIQWSDKYIKAQEQDNLLKEQFATYKDLAKLISQMYQINDAPIIQNHLEAENECNKLDSIMHIQGQMSEYIANRKLVEKLHAEITTTCSSYKGCAKAYKTFSKNYPVIWNTEKDNNKYIKDVLSMLQEIKSTLTDQENLPQIDNALKKAKTLDEIKSLFRISK